MSELHVAIDGACWWNDRGFGRFTREIITALAARTEGIRYSMVLEHEAPAGSPLPAPPSALQLVTAGTRPMADATAGSGARSISHMLRMGRALGALRADVVFFPAIYSWVPVHPSRPSVVTVHDAIPERFPRLVFPRRRNEWLWRLKSGAARRKAARVLTVSQASADQLVEVLGVRRERIDVTSEAADPVFTPRVVAHGDLLQPFGLPSRPFFLYVGGFNAHKNVPLLLEAFAAVPGEPCLVLVGDTSGEGFHDDVPALRRWLGDRPDVARRVALPGWLPDDELVSLYSAATALVMPSLAEGFGLPAIEAMACGCPVICSDRTSLPEVVGSAGLLVDPTDKAALAAAMARVLNEVGLTERMSSDGVRRAATFTWDRAAAMAETSLRRASESS
ncbi:MAG: glycosyltransferase family 4 protein [Deltaproteobacteria bacterium]|nr:glycosyltransferase family 4 protein [Deltaproteobacteria bacterium]